MQVLIAEDSRTVRHVMQDAVEGLGHDCAVAADGAEAWERFQAGGADVVISDWLMPGLDGLELCQRIRAQQRAEYTYFIFLTSLTDRQHALRGIEAGADDYLPKPLDYDDLRLRLIVAERVTALHRERTIAQLQAGRLQGVHLAAHTMQHELGNTLTRTSGYTQLLASQATLTAEGQAAAQQALRGVQEAIAIVQRLEAVATLEETDWGPNIPPTIDLARSSE